MTPHVLYVIEKQQIWITISICAREEKKDL